MAITTMDQIAAGLAAAPVIDLFAPSAINVAAGFVNLQRAVVTSTGQMAVPAAASALLGKKVLITLLKTWVKNLKTYNLLGLILLEILLKKIVCGCPRQRHQR